MLRSVPSTLCRAWLLALLLPLTACRSADNGPQRLDLQLTIQSKQPVTRQEMERAEGHFTSIRPAQKGRGCRGGGGFAAYHAETPVDVLDQQGNVLGRSKLGIGSFEAAGHSIDARPLFSACHFQVGIPLAAPARIYVLRLGDEALIKRLHVSQLRRTNGVVKLKMD